jgi:hypothetical protein
MESDYFSDVEKGIHTCTQENIPNNAWLGIRAIIIQRFDNNNFSVDQSHFYDLLKAEIPDLDWPLTENTPPLSDLLDLLQFCYKYIDYPLTQRYRDKIENELYDGYSSNKSLLVIAGQMEFRDTINLIFYRNCVTYRIERDGTISRSIPEEIKDMVMRSVFQTDDPIFNELMNAARTKFLDPDIEIRKDSLEKLWGAFERLKTFEGKKEISMPKILQQVSPEPNFFLELEIESKALTRIGNNFLIRHKEKVQVLIESPHHIDYLFYRLFSMIYLILKSTKRINSS